jgi:hypothetical protein
MKLRLLLVAASLIACRKPHKLPVEDAQPPPAVRVLATNQDHPWGLTVDETHVYFTNKGAKGTRGSLARVSKSGGEVETLVNDLEVPWGVAVANGRVYWSGSKPGYGGLGSISLVDKTSIDKPRPVTGALEEPWAIVVRGNRLFLTDLHTRRVSSVALNASVDLNKIATIATTDSQPTALAVDDTNVYWVDSLPGVISRASLDGGPITMLVARGEKTTGLAIDDTSLYWCEWGGGRIGKVLKAGGGLATLAVNQQGVRSIAVDEQRVYWVHPPSGSIRSISKNGGPIHTHATDQKHPYALTVDATSIFWANVDGGTVASIEKRLP